MIPTHTIPSLSGTFGIPASLALIPKMPKEPLSPSHSNGRIERQLHGEGNQGQRTTANISKLGKGGLPNFCTFNKKSNDLISRWHGNPSLLILAKR